MYLLQYPLDYVSDFFSEGPLTADLPFPSFEGVRGTHELAKAVVNSLLCNKPKVSEA